MQVKFIDLTTSQEWYDIDEGATITRNLNETLNSSSIRISHISEDLELQPLDDVIIRGSFGTMNFCIESYNQYQVSLDPIIYTYEINLCSLAKKLEGIILPNISNTPRKIGDKVSIRSFATKILAQYSPKLVSNNQQVYQLSLPAEETQWDDECPELQWNTPNLREILNDLLMLRDCVVVVNRVGNIYYILRMNLFETDDEIVSSQFNYIKRAQSVNDYASELKMNLQNSMNTKQNDILDTITSYEHLHFTCNDFVINDTNFYLQTKFPILRIKHLWMTWYIENQQPSPDGYVEIKADLCNLKFPDDSITYSLVKELKEYEVLDVKGTVGLDSSDFPSNSAELWSKTKNSCIYYSRGSNIIDGFRAINKATTVVNTMLTLQIVARAVGLDYLNRNNIARVVSSWQGIGEVDNLYITPTFEIEYETSAGCVFSASKNDVPRNQRTIMDNQTNAWVDTYTQGKLEYQKANRIGNQVLEFNGRVLDYDNAIQLRQTYGNVVIYRTEYQFFEEFVNVTAYGTRNFVLRDYFTGVNSKIRTWVNAREEAFIRHDLHKYYVEFSKTDKLSQVSSNFGLATNYFASAFASTKDAKPIKYAMIMTNYNSNTYPEKDLIGRENEQYNEWYFATELSTRLVGSSIVLTTGFDDNLVGKKTFRFGTHSGQNLLKDDGVLALPDIDNWDTTEYGGIDSIIPPVISANSSGSFWSFLFGIFKKSDDIKGGIPFTSIKYANNEGNTTSLTLIFRDEYPLNPHSGKTRLYDYYKNQFDREYQASNVFKDKYVYYKDNKEITQVSVQFEFCSDTPDIEFTDLFIRRQLMIRTEEWNNFPSLAIFGANTYDGLQIICGTENNISFSTSSNGNTHFVLTPTSDYDWYIIKGYYLNEENQLVTKEIMRTKHKEFYLSIRRSRNEKEYNI